MTKIDKEFLINLVGKKIRFTEAIDAWGTYAEEGMYAIVTKFRYEDDDFPVHKIWLDFSPFESHNHPRQNANYYNDELEPCLTALEAGYYKPVDDIYIDEEIENLPFEIVED